MVFKNLYLFIFLPLTVMFYFDMGLNHVTPLLGGYISFSSQYYRGFTPRMMKKKNKNLYSKHILVQGPSKVYPALPEKHKLGHY